MSKPVSRVCNVRVAGPLAPFAADFTSRLEELGYTPLTRVNELRLMAHLSRWLEASQLTGADLDGERIGLFLSAQRAGGYGAPGAAGGLGPLLGGLRRARLVSADEVLVGSFRRYLLNERALAPSTAAAYTDRARRFLAARAGADLAGLTAGDVTRAVLAESGAVSAGAVQYFVAALRSFLRFCFAEGLVEADLSGAALAATGRRRSPLPMGISQAAAAALLGSCDRREPGGRRDYAVLITLLRLGLRAGEAAGLTLDDIDWRAGEMVVRGKGRREDRLPLPADVGEAIAGYLRPGRPGTACREVFVRAVAPVTGLGRGGGACIRRPARTPAGLGPGGPHPLRHTAAGRTVGCG